MAIRLLATYEFIDKDGHAAGAVRLPVVGYSPHDADGRERPRVLLLAVTTRISSTSTPTARWKHSTAPSRRY